MNWLNKIEKFLEKIDSYRDKALFVFIKPYWPRKIIPNYITSIRVIIGVILFVLLFTFSVEEKWIIVWLFIIGMLTDFIDGPIARGTSQVTEFGAMLDSTADRVLILPIAFYSLLAEKWLLLALVLTEIANGLFSLHFKSKEIYLESNIFGKTKMLLLCIVFAGILIYWPESPSIYFVILLWCSIPLSVLSIISKTYELKNK